MDKLRCFIETCKDISIKISLWDISFYSLILWIPLGLSIGIFIFFVLPQDPGLFHLILSVGVVCGGAGIVYITKRLLGWPILFAFVGLGFMLPTFKTHVVYGDTHMLTRIQEHKWSEGVVCEVESTTKGPRYVIRLSSFPIKRTEKKNVAVMPDLRFTQAVAWLINLRIRDPELQCRLIENNGIWGTGSQIARFLIRCSLEKSNVWDDRHKNNLHKVRLSTRMQQPHIQVGDHVRFLATLLPISGPAVPGGYDFRRQAFFQGLNAVGYLEGGLQVLGREESLIHHINDLRSRIRQQIKVHLPGSEGAIATALITGERAPIAPQVNEAFNNSGLAHILSISGLHFSILAGLVFFACRRLLSLIPPLAHGYDLKKGAACVVILVSVLYALMAGGSVPVVRSFLMIFAAMVAVLMDRDPISMRLVALAATCILVISPEALFTASFQMSFAAVMGLVAFYENRQAKPKTSLQGTLWAVTSSMLLTTVVASVATAPFTLYHFGRVTLYAVLANALAIPLTAFWIMPCILLIMLLMPFGFEGMVIQFLGLGIKGLVMIAEKVADFPYSSIIIPPLPSLNTIGFMAMTVSGGLMVCLGPFTWRKVGGSMMVCACFWLWGARPYDVLVQQNPFVLMMRAGRNHALCLGKVQPYLIDQWSKAMGVEANQVTLVPLCDQSCRHKKGQMCMRNPVRIVGMSLPLSSLRFEHNHLPQAFIRDGQSPLTPLSLPQQQRRWMR